MKHTLSILLLALAMSSPLWARDTVFVSGAVSHEGLLDWKPVMYHSNSYADIALHYQDDSNRLGFQELRLNTRLEMNQWPMPGYETDFAGHGIGHLSLNGTFAWGEISLGDVYDQFGSGLILSLREERALGQDNALRGAKFLLKPYKGIDLTLLGGKQRRYWNCYHDGAWGWNYGRDAVVGADLELAIHEWSPRMQAADVGLTIGGSYVSKYERADTILTIIDNKQYRYNLPEWVGAGDVRAELQVKGWDVLVEYAYKANDPCAENKYNYRPGQALMVSLSYSRKGMSLLAQVKRSENMDFRSERQRRGLAGRLNYMPAFTQQHTYTLPAYYPYATQYAGGEWAFQAEIRYTWPRKTRMGGRYGTMLKLAGSHVRGLAEEGSWRVDGSSDGEYYTDINLELNKRISKRWRMNAMLMYQAYNRQIVEGHGDLVRAGIAVLENHVVLTDAVSLRHELQYLYTRQHEGQWIMTLLELNLYHCVTLTGQYEYNIGYAPEHTREHYYSALVTYTHGAHRLMGGYIKTSAGYNCTGGVCRFVPQQEGITLSYNFTW